jgi:hypothetical protein
MMNVTLLHDFFTLCYILSQRFAIRIRQHVIVMMMMMMMLAAAAAVAAAHASSRQAMERRK